MGCINNFVTEHHPKKNHQVFFHVYGVTLLKLHDFPLPDWAIKVYPMLGEPAGLFHAMSTWTLDMKRLRGGPLVKEILANMKKKIVAGMNGPPTRNITVYSAHDTTVANFLNTIGLYNYLPPPFASMVLVELRQTPKKEFLVLVLFKNSTNPYEDPYLLDIPMCAQACPIMDLERLWAPVMPVDWDAECRGRDD